MRPEEATRDHRPSASFDNRIDQALRDLVQIGQVNELHLATSTTAAAAQWPLRVGMPPALAAARQRRGLDDRLAAGLAALGEATCQILSGMGGAGKTQAAAGYAHERWRSGELDLMVWVNAASRDAVLATYSQAAVAVCGADSEDIEANASAFHAWLDRPTGRRWLVVLDDLSDPADLNGLWPPANPQGRAVVTTRRRDAALDGAGRSRMTVDLFTESECLEFLRQRLNDDSAVLRGAGGLAADLGFLPLALAQAAAYILDQPGMTCEDYRLLLSDRSVALAQLRPDSLPDGHDRSAAAAWSLSIERVDAVAPAGAASALLRMMSLLDHNGIPIKLLTSDAAVGFVARAVASDEPVDVSAMTVSRVLGRLDRMSLLDHNGDLVRFHAMIQRSVFDTIDEAVMASTARAAAEALVQVWPERERYSALSSTLRSNTAYLLRSARRVLLDHGVHEVLFKAGDSLGNHGSTRDAMGHFAMLRSETAHLGGEHPDVLRIRNHIANWQKATGDMAGALKSLEELVTDCTEFLGADHPHTLEARSSLADRRGESGDAPGAATVLEEVVADRARLLGRDHPLTLVARFKLVRWRGQSGDAAYAVEELRRLVPEIARRLGRDHVDTLTARAGLARWLGRSGDEAAAAEQFAGLLSDRERVLGPRHPDTLNTRYHLATWTGRSGRKAQAVEMLEALAPELAAVHGPNHPRTHRARASLACWRGETGDTTTAVAELTELLSIQSETIGADHPFVLESRHNLGRLQRQAGEGDAAAATLKALVADRVRILGTNHPLTRAARRDLEAL